MLFILCQSVVVCVQIDRRWTQTKKVGHFVLTWYKWYISISYVIKYSRCGRQVQRCLVLRVHPQLVNVGISQLLITSTSLLTNNVCMHAAAVAFNWSFVFVLLSSFVVPSTTNSLLTHPLSSHAHTTQHHTWLLPHQCHNILTQP